MRIKFAAIFILSLLIVQQIDISLAANKTQTKKVKLGKGLWIDCKKFRRQGPVLIKIDSKGKWLCWTGKAN